MGNGDFRPERGCSTEVTMLVSEQRSQGLHQGTLRGVHMSIGVHYAQFYWHFTVGLFVPMVIVAIMVQWVHYVNVSWTFHHTVKRYGGGGVVGNGSISLSMLVSEQIA